MLKKIGQQITFALLVYNRIVMKGKKKIRYNLCSFMNFDIF